MKTCQLTGRGFINEIDVGREAKRQDNGNLPTVSASSFREIRRRAGAHSLKFTAGQILHFLVNEVIKLEGLHNIRLELRGEERRLDLLEE